ncbi:MAG: hypothetical protein WEF51_06130 [Chloroflexota bacterium]
MTLTRPWSPASVPGLPKVVMDEIALLAELLFLVLFVATSISWIRHRDPISLDLSLIFSGLGLLFLLQLWERVTGIEPPALLSQAVTLLFFVLQPLFTLHLVSLVRRLPRAVLIGSTVVMATRDGCTARRPPP